MYDLRDVKSTTQHLRRQKSHTTRNGSGRKDFLDQMAVVIYRDIKVLSVKTYLPCRATQFARAFDACIDNLFGMNCGGGFGWTNSSGGAQGLGQDFTFNWFSQLGLRRKITAEVSLLGGLYFIHHSNLGLTDPNPGIDALGFTLGCAWTF